MIILLKFDFALLLNAIPLNLLLFSLFLFKTSSVKGPPCFGMVFVLICNAQANWFLEISTILTQDSCAFLFLVFLVGVLTPKQTFLTRIVVYSSRIVIFLASKLLQITGRLLRNQLWWSRPARWLVIFVFYENSFPWSRLHFLSVNWLLESIAYMIYTYIVLLFFFSLLRLPPSQHTKMMLAGQANPNSQWLNARGVWLTYILLIVILHLILLSMPFQCFSVPVVWTLTNTIHNMVSQLDVFLKTCCAVN